MVTGVHNASTCWLMATESKALTDWIMVLKLETLLVTEPKPLPCKKSPDYPFKQTVIIDAVLAIPPDKKVPKLPKNNPIHYY